MRPRRIAYIDLSNRNIIKEDIPAEWWQKYLGGRGLNAYLLYSLLDPQADPLGPQNPLLVGAGFLTGAPGLGAARLDISAISPMSGNLGSSNIGGFFSPELRAAGFEHLVITGKSQTPVYLMVKDGDIQIRDARHLWGMDTWQTQEALKRENGDDRVRALVIGPAGEKLVRLACVMTGPKDAAGRYGMGAVMGSKNLKAIAARGTMDIPVAHPKELLAYLKELYDWTGQSFWVKGLQTFGTPHITETTNEAGVLYTKDGWGPPLGEAARDVYGYQIGDKYSQGMASCYGCFVHCRHRYLIKEGPYAGVRDEGPEYVSVYNFLCCQAADLDKLMYANHLFNRLGLDTSGAMQMIRFAMHLYEHGIITEADLGRELPWGDAEGILSLISDIAHRRGFGDVLADGPYALRKLPAQAATYLPLFKNAVPLVTWMRVVIGMVLAQVVSTIPGHQHRCESPLEFFSLPEELLRSIYGGYVSSSPQSYEGKARMIWWNQLLHAMSDSLGYCLFLQVYVVPEAPKFEEFSRLLKLVEDLDIPPAQLMEIGERIYTTERLILGRLGVGTRQFDTLPEVYFQPSVGGTYPGFSVDREKLQQFLDEHYELHGWDRNGVPTPELVDRLGISPAKIAAR
jgi:aldehyde:ferredoxin oxidoreductase